MPSRAKDIYPTLEPYEHEMLEVGDGNRIYWEACGNPRGKPAVVLHGGPGSGCTWIEDEELLRGAGSLADVPGIMINGRFDFQAPIGNAWALKRVWPRAELTIVDSAGHAADHTGIARELVHATDRLGKG